MLNLYEDPDIQRWLQSQGEQVPDPLAQTRLAQDPEIAQFAGIPPAAAAAPAPVMTQPWNGAQYDMDAPPGGPARAVAPAPAAPLLTRPAGVPTPMYNAVENAAQTRVEADDSAIRAKEQELGVMREYYNARRSELQAEQDTQREELERQNAAAKRYELESQEIANESDAPVDPTRYMSDIGPAGQLVTALAAAAWGFVNPQAVARGENPVAEMLQQGINNDIAAQRVDIQSGQARRANRLTLLTQKLGSAEAASGRLRIELANMADKLLDAEVKSVGQQADPATIKAARDELAAQRAQGQAELQKALYAMQPKVPKGAGDKAAQDAKRALDMYKEGEAMGMTHQERAQMLTRAGLNGYIPPEPTGKSARTQEKEAEAERKEGERMERRTDAAREDIKKDTRVLKEREMATVRAAKAFGLTVEKQGDKYVVSGNADEPHTGKEGTEKDDALSQMSKAETMGMSREPAAVLQTEYSKADKPPFRDALKQQFFQRRLDMLNEIRASVEEQYDPDVLKRIKDEAVTGKPAKQRDYGTLD